jgi:hypothetical protein
MEVWQYRPQGPVVESLEWLTDVIGCKRVEYRLCLRKWPRQTFACAYQMDEQTYGRARQKAAKVGGDELYVPDWPRLAEMPLSVPAGTVSLLVDTAHAPSYHVGGSLLLMESAGRFEVCTIAAKGTGVITVAAPVTQSYTRPTVVPLRVGTFAQPFEGKRPPAHYNTISAVFNVVVTEDMTDASAEAYPAYLGYPVVDNPRETIKDVSDKVEREVDTFDSKTGPIANYALKSAPTTAMSLSITTTDLQDMINVRSFLASVRGRWKAFWLPSWNADFTLTKDISPGDSFIQIEAIGFAATYAVGTDVALITASGFALAIRVTSVTTSAGNELLHFAGAFGSGLSKDIVYKACKLTLSRLDADRVEIQYMPGLAAKVVVPTQEVTIYP